jgi:hypothetical protein
MKSNVCKIEKGVKDLEAILKESEMVAKYNGLDHKQSLQLRLICEEIDGMLPNIIDNFTGDFWIDFEKGVCKICVDLEFEEFTSSKKKELISVAKNKKNANATGFLGKIRSALEDVFLDGEVYKAYDMAGLFNSANEYCVGMGYTYAWSLQQYKEVSKEEKEWDELEKSIITSVADDVIVGVKGRKASIVIVKKFA